MKELICIVCPKGCRLQIDETKDYAVTGNNCEKGAEYGRNELIHPVRTVTSTVKINGALLPRCPVKTSKPIPKEKIFSAMRLLDEITLSSPIPAGAVVIKNILGTGSDFITTRRL